MAVVLNSCMNQIWRLLLPGPDGNCHRPELLGPVVEAQPAREKPVAHDVLEDVRGAHPCHVHAPGHQVLPRGDVRLRVIDHRGIARGAGGGVQAHDLVQGNGKEPVGKASRRSAFVVNGSSPRSEASPHRGFLPGRGRRGPGCPAQRGGKAFALQPLKRRALHRLDIPVPVHGL